MTPYILAIESSCDEMAAAVYHEQRGIISNVLFSQTSLHQRYGGVIPEIASRSHLEKVIPIVTQALEKAQITLHDIQAIAVTHKPGLPGSLMIGVCFAKALAWSLNKPLIGVNHLEGHIFSSFLEHDVPFEHICLTASGGHTALYAVHDLGAYTLVGQTVDDAAGEAFDKIAKLLQLPYPGGPVIEKLAHQQHFQDFFNYPRGQAKVQDFSFSGLKTAVMYDLVKRGWYDMATKKLSCAVDDVIKQQVASSLLVCIRDIFINKLTLAVQAYPASKAVTFVGGVACNKYLKAEIAAWCAHRNLQFFTPAAQYCTDNAAMIAFVGAYKYRQGQLSDMSLDILR